MSDDFNLKNKGDGGDYIANRANMLAGFEGTEEEWLESLHGEDGKSAYEVAVIDGFEGTMTEWLESLVGPKGDAGGGSGGDIGDVYNKGEVDVLIKASHDKIKNEVNKSSNVNDFSMDGSQYNRYPGQFMSKRLGGYEEEFLGRPMSEFWLSNYDVDEGVRINGGTVKKDLSIKTELFEDMLDGYGIDVVVRIDGNASDSAEYPMVLETSCIFEFYDYDLEETEFIEISNPLTIVKSADYRKLQYLTYQLMTGDFEDNYGDILIRQWRDKKVISVEVKIENKLRKDIIWTYLRDIQISGSMIVGDEVEGTYTDSLRPIDITNYETYHPVYDYIAEDEMTVLSFILERMKNTQPKIT